MFYKEHIGKHLFDNIYLRKGNGKAGTFPVLSLGHWLIFRTVTAHMTAKLRVKAEEALCTDSKFIIQTIAYRWLPQNTCVLSGRSLT